MIIPSKYQPLLIWLLSVTILMIFNKTQAQEWVELRTGDAEVAGATQIQLSHLIFQGTYYDAVIQINENRTYQVLQAVPSSIETSARYRVTFSSSWSQDSHPFEYPVGQSHFSGLIGATHDHRVNFWKPGEVASDGIENMAETGSKVTFGEEITQAISQGTAQNGISGGGISQSPGEVELEFNINHTHPLVTLTAMLAPSPDWFVGVRDLNLIQGGHWAEHIIIPLYVYDAGTDSGTSYLSPDSDTQPREFIRRLEDQHFVVSGELTPIGSFSFKRVN